MILCLEDIEKLNHQIIDDVVMIIFCSRLVSLIVAIFHAMKTKYCYNPYFYKTCKSKHYGGIFKRIHIL